MLITNQRNVQKGTIYLGNQPIEWVKSYKYLGVTIDDKLTWNQHIQNVSNKANMVMAQCRRMMGSNWGLRPYVCKYMYIGLVRPILTYAGLGWLKVTKQPSKLAKIRRVQRKALLSITNAMVSTPTASMEVIVDILPLDIFIEMTAVNSYLRLFRNNNWKPQPGEIVKKLAHSNIVNTITRNIEGIHMPIDKLRYKQFLDSNFEIKILSREEIERAGIKLKPTEQDKIHVFTDGSKDELSSGCAFIYKGKHEGGQNYRNLGKYSTVFLTEITAIEDAANRLLEIGARDKIIEFYVDSQAAILSLNKYIVTSAAVESCKRKLNQLGLENQVTINWVKSHIGIMGNEVVDRLAKLGAGLIDEIDEPVIPVAAQVIKRKINVWAENKHKHRWKSKRKHILEKFEYKETKVFLPEPTGKIWRQLRNLSRREARICTAIVTGHSLLQKHLYRMKKADFPDCEECMEWEEETSVHFLCECMAYCTIRFEIFGKQFLEPKDLKTMRLKQILRFVSASGREL